MPKSLSQIQKQIAKLQAEAEALRKKEAGDVIARIKEAIAHYNITPEELFGGRASVGGTRAAKVGRGQRAGAAKGKRKTVGVIRFRDDTGNAWTGHGRRPQWYVNAIASGKTADQLAV